jgi:hypothetical protein
MKGSIIIVRDYSGNALIRKIWEVTDTGVLVTTSDLLNCLEHNDNSIFAIGFPLKDCFIYDDSLSGVDGQAIDFANLTPFVPK